jgi:hypothetical protein
MITRHEVKRLPKLNRMHETKSEALMRLIISEFTPATIPFSERRSLGADSPYLDFDTSVMQGYYECEH